jgi:hypothetical protein
LVLQRTDQAQQRLVHRRRNPLLKHQVRGERRRQILYERELNYNFLAMKFTTQHDLNS